MKVVDYKIVLPTNSCRLSDVFEQVKCIMVKAAVQWIRKLLLNLKFAYIFVYFDRALWKRQLQGLKYSENANMLLSWLSHLTCQLTLNQKKYRLDCTWLAKKKTLRIIKLISHRNFQMIKSFIEILRPGTARRVEESLNAAFQYNKCTVYRYPEIWTWRNDINKYFDE